MANGASSDQVLAKESQGINRIPSSSGISQILNRFDEFAAKLQRFEQYNISGDISGAYDLSIDHAAETGMEREPTSTPGALGEGTTSLSSDDIQIEGSLPTGTEHQGQASEPVSIVQLAWKIFVFGDEGSEEVGMAVFEEARQAAARSLRPLDSPVFLAGEAGSDGTSNIATFGTLYTHPEDEATDFSAHLSPTEATGSVEATYDPSMVEAGSDLEVVVLDGSTYAPSIEVNVNTSSVSEMENFVEMSDASIQGLADETENISSRPHRHILSSTAASLAVAPPQSDLQPTETGSSSEHFRFAQPKLFVGNRSSLQQPLRVVEPSFGISLAKRRRGRPKKRANDGRADIRALPNYSSDPIEEFELEGKGGRGQERLPPSLFPALELS
ncbi:hypothetical protein N0V88_002410 [Collariella sp. IMI 366227]|nr:hypothetical protein N0V88_002410 [Collariella sp. IMI 366227]